MDKTATSDMAEAPLNDLLQLSLQAAITAGQVIMKIYDSGDFDITTKGDESPLTRADLASHEEIKSHLSGTGIPMLSEEGRSISYQERQDWKRLWIIDPIDGTKEFIKRNGEFTVNIALVENGVPILGVVYAPAKGQLFYGDQLNGAYLAEGGSTTWEMADWKAAACTMPQPSEERSFTAVASRSHMSPETEAYIEELRQLHGTVDLISRGSSLKLCMVAAGFADCYPRFAPTMEWDTAAGQAVCLAAGCEVMNWETKSALTYNREELLNPWFLVRGPRALRSQE